MNDLFGEEIRDSKDEWKGMPEFVQEKEEPYQKIIIRFGSKEDVDEFARLIAQKITHKTKSIWFPFKSHWGKTKKEWVNNDESTISNLCSFQGTME